ncbi:hypothetical protein OQA88_286 [Cercophora sp. LCS_1]
MTSVASASASASPLSGYEFPHHHGSDDNETDESQQWTIMSIPNSAGPASSVGFFPSPATSAALGSSWGFVGGPPHAQHQLHNNSSSEPASSLPAASPLNLDSSTEGVFATDTSFDSFGSTTGAQQGGVSFAETLFQEDFFAAAAAGNSLLSAQFADLNNLISDQFTPFTSAEQQALSSLDFSIPDGLLPGADVPPWNPMAPDLRDTGDSPSLFVMEDPSFASVSVSPSPPYQHSPSVSVSPRSPPLQIKREDVVPKTTPIAIHKVHGNARVAKKSTTRKSHSTSPLSSSGGSSTFLIVTPDSVNAHADKSNPFDCHDLSRSSQRGRKGPLANETKESALKVRRLGACFHCHARKVKCEETRPCRNCAKLKLVVPHAMCWQFDDFDIVLFPDFLRTHFAKDEMARFISDNIEGFTVNGVEKACTVELSAGRGFAATMSIKAKFFTARTVEVLQQWHLENRGNAPDLNARNAAPIGLDPGTGTHKEELRKKTDKYVQAMLGEGAFADLVTETRHTRLPRTIIQIVQNYAQRTDNTMVKRALSIYAMHYIMTHQLCLTEQTIVNLGLMGMVSQETPFLTPRVLNRQLKAVIDDMLRQEMGKLFKSFGSTLKPKERKGWAPCLAAFLVLCLFMEAVEAAADTFVITENQICFRNRQAPKWKRSFALGKNAEIENMPFKQVAFQFHQLYQTHSRDAGSRSFNPLLDDASLEQELDRDAAAMVMQLRRLLQAPWWGELDFLSMDPILPNQERYPIDDVAFNYTGRLVAKFLLSFEDESYIIDRND